MDTPRNRAFAWQFLFAVWRFSLAFSVGRFFYLPDCTWPRRTRRRSTLHVWGAAILTWGTPIWAIATLGIPLALYHKIASVLGFSHHRQKQQMRGIAQAFVVGLFISITGLLSGMAEKAPINLLYGLLTNLNYSFAQTA